MFDIILAQSMLFVEDVLLVKRHRDFREIVCIERSAGFDHHLRHHVSFG